MTPIEHIVTWPDVFQSLVNAIPTYIAAVGAILAAYLARQAVSQGKELHVTMNSRLTELLKATASSSHAEGVIQGAREGRASSIVETDARAVQAAGPAPTVEQRLSEIRGET
jgi:hypothetical protein